MLKPHPRVPVSLALPPPKQRCQVEPARSAESARMAKPCTERTHPYNPATQRVRSTVLATVHELVAPPPPAVPATQPKPAPAVSAPTPKPAKGCMKIPPHQDPVKPGTQWIMPAIFRGVRQCRRWCGVAAHRSPPIPQDAVAIVGSRCYRPPPQNRFCHGGRQALAACP